MANNNHENSELSQSSRASPVSVMKIVKGFLGLVVIIAFAVTAINKFTNWGANNSGSGGSLPSKYKSLRGSAADNLKDWMLASTGKGNCDSVTNSSMDNLRFGTAAYRFGKPGLSISGSYTANCTYYIVGKKVDKLQTYWFHITQEPEGDNLNGAILLDNPDAIERSLVQSNFEQEFPALTPEKNAENPALIVATPLNQAPAVTVPQVQAIAPAPSPSIIPQVETPDFEPIAEGGSRPKN